MSRMKSAVKQKEIALASEKSELKETIGDLTNFVKMQKKRICELTSICTKQRNLLRDKENCLSKKIVELSAAEEKIQSENCKCSKMKEEIEKLTCRLNEEIVIRNNLQAQLDERKDNCNCELQIKNKIIADQAETIKKLKKVSCVQNSRNIYLSCNYFYIL